MGAVQFTILSAVLLCSTFVPRGALSLNPALKCDGNQTIVEDTEAAMPAEGESVEEGIEMSSGCTKPENDTGRPESR